MFEKYGKRSKNRDQKLDRGRPARSAVHPICPGAPIHQHKFVASPGGPMTTTAKMLRSKLGRQGPLNEIYLENQQIGSKCRNSDSLVILFLSSNN